MLSDAGYQSEVPSTWMMSAKPAPLFGTQHYVLAYGESIKYPSNPSSPTAHTPHRKKEYRMRSTHTIQQTDHIHKRGPTVQPHARLPRRHRSNGEARGRQLCANARLTGRRHRQMYPPLYAHTRAHARPPHSPSPPLTGEGGSTTDCPPSPFGGEVW